MGLLDTVADVASGVADAAPIPGSDLVASGIDAAQGALGGGDDNGGGGGGSSRPQLPAPTGQQQTPSSPPVSRRDSSGVSFGGSVPGFGSAEFSASSVSEEQGGSGGSGGQELPMQGGFQGAIMMEMLEDAISGQDGRAVLEAMTSGALQQGVIQRPTNVQTPRGTRNVSPPGFRTVYLGGDSDSDAYAVFKPLAKSLGLIGRESPKTFREKLDDTTRDYLKHRKEFKDLAKKLGLKTDNRKSGPSR